MVTVEILLLAMLSSALATGLLILATCYFIAKARVRG